MLAVLRQTSTGLPRVAPLVVLLLTACARPAPPVAPPVAPTPAEAPFDPATIDLESAAAHYAAFDPYVCHTLLLRAHEEVAALEAAPTDENRPRRWRLHAIAATCVEFAYGSPLLPFYEVVDGKTVNLHDLRNAQLLVEDPSLQSDRAHTLDRLESILFLAELSRGPAFAQDAERVLAR